MATPSVATMQAQYIHSLTQMNDLELQQERQTAVTNGDSDALNFITMELVNRMMLLSQQVQTLSQQVSQLQTNPPVHTQPTLAATTTVFQQKTIKIERPQNFDGTPSKLSNFLFTVGQYMDTTGLADDVQRCQFAATLLRGRALTWWRTWVDRLPMLAANLTFTTFSAELEKSFRDVDHVDRLRRRLASLRQVTSVQKYIDEFRTIVIELGSAKPDDDTVLFQFINGLKPAVQLQVRISRPIDIVAAEQAAEQTDSALFLATRGGHVQKGHKPYRGPAPMDLGAVEQKPQTRPPTSGVTCHRCGKLGHIRRDCRVKLPGSQGQQGAPNGRWRQDGYQGQRANIADVAPQFPPPPTAGGPPKNA